MNKTIENIFSLTFLQIMNLVLPLLTYPYVLKVLGSEIFGNIVFAQTLMSFLSILVSFGFGMSATRLISVHRLNQSKLNEIVSSVTIVKFVIFLILIAVIIPLILYKTDGYLKWLYFLSFWIVIYEIVFPIYFFQGMEDMKYMAVIIFFTKIIFVFLIFVFLKSKQDILLFPFFNLIGTLFAGIISYYYLGSKYRIVYYVPRFSIIKSYLVESFSLFLSNISAQVYVYSGKIFIGNCVGMTELAYYDMAEKIVGMFKLPQGVLSQSLFPRVSLTKDVFFLKKIFLYSFFGNLLLYILLCFVSGPLIVLVGGSQMVDSKSFVILLGLTIPIVSMSNVLGTLIMVPLGLSKLYSKALIFTSFFFVVLLSGAYFFKLTSVNAVITIVVLTEVFVCLLMIYYLNIYGVWKRNLII
jgi:O-antigen/teichoic acid export membrane protein